MPSRTLLTLTAAALGLVFAGRAAAQFTPGNLAVVRIGDGTTALSASGFRTDIVEVNPATGAVVGTPIDLNAAAVAAGLSGFTNGNNANAPGLNLSTDRSALLTVGYNAAVGTANVATTANVSRTVARIGPGGTVSFQAFSNGADSPYQWQTIRGAASTDGSQVWTSGISSGGTTPHPSQGLFYAPNPSVTVPTQVLNVTPRHVEIANDNLYFTVSGAVQAFTGLPTSAASPTAALTAGLDSAVLSSPFGFTFVNRFNTANTPGGVDTLYVVDNVSGGQAIKKFFYDVANQRWAPAGATPLTLNVTEFGLTTRLNGTDVELYVTTTSITNSLRRYTDNTALDGGISALTPDWQLSSGANFTFRGVDFVPVPEPGTVLAVAAAGLGLAGLVRRRRRFLAAGRTRR